ncbi:alkanesulfonate monooxygenase SsuD/methylene tetrahydromethanopterin reductase-like flavin-dependent oxidoreductase (luciferase family) [Actinoplanes campanulatus]|uniref:Alkanesulfonate monooxygenase SsuD/methylene tetrahydromethanopterin reductase-like flavin-dependent oxidoreductase (Luciferase family) n=1 Tax=Actinoplanes campanulatus TaxID=113559 RepID=A0A7W5AMR2_9ACTN|nr:LLM class flavin-dependent oxidoreductase [Actinoplanes campanulatus]MBB3098902.1 alkanesulfonate monooxygenase SsuD/methylene tetrahydromethanopterin reductase-like flavin-dependent oxidoreductase (luciferase family) [Actinoplanes campanulatus]GGN39965.1 N5,N10-methylene tetrahydromethanopterin reductase [Actinoplanes campanulatus]GID40106.1 N5,N10-methylene tetrahydromethanopterin reductase [Actinoplanes campanulatus]
MTDYGHDLLFGVFVTPTAEPVRQAVDAAVAADRAGLDLVTFQDHPYVTRLADTWTLMSYVAARTERIRISGNVLSLPMRPPAVLARSHAALDRLTGGRIEMGLGAGAFWDGIEGMGQRRLTPGQAVDALDEAIQVIREVWDADAPGGIRFDGEYYRVAGAKRGPAPAHDMSIWVGAYKPRMLRLIGRAADGVLPSLSYLPGGIEGYTEINRHIDGAAVEAGREPAAVRRLLNIDGTFAPAGTGFLKGPPEQWAEDLAGVALEHGVSAFILATDDPAVIATYAGEVAPAARELVAAERDRT